MRAYFEILGVCRWVAFAITVLMFSIIFYRAQMNIAGLEFLQYVPFTIGSGVLSILLPSGKSSTYPKVLLKHTIQLVSFLIGLGLLIALYIGVKDRSPVKYAGKFFWEEGLFIEFREDHTFKAINDDFVSKLFYGEYSELDDAIVLHDKIMFGFAELNDTLCFTEEGLKFTLKTEWRIKEGVLRFSK